MAEKEDKKKDTSIKPLQKGDKTKDFLDNQKPSELENEIVSAEQDLNKAGTLGKKEESQTSKTPKKYYETINPDELPPELKENYEWIKKGETDVEQFRKDRLKELSTYEEELKKEYEQRHKKFSQATPEQIRSTLQDPKYKESMSEFRKHFDNLSLEKHKVATDPNDVLEAMKRKFENDRLNYLSEKKFSSFRPDTSFFDQNRLLPKEYLDKKPFFDKMDKYYEYSAADKKKAKEMLESDKNLRDAVKEKEREKIARMHQGLMENAKLLNSAIQNGEEVSDETIKQYHQNEKFLNDMSNEFHELFPEEKIKAEEEKRKQDEERERIQNPFKRAFLPETKRKQSGNSILYVSDVHDNLEGLSAVFGRASTLRQQSKLKSVVLGGDLIRGGFFDKKDLVKYQKAIDRLGMISQLKGSSFYMASPFEMLDDEGKVNEEFERRFGNTDIKEDVKRTLEDYAEMYFKAKKNIKLKLEEIKSLAKKYNLLDYLVFSPGNYEGAAPLIEVFGEDSVVGFSNISKYEYQLDYEMQKNKAKKKEDRKEGFRSKVVDVDGLRIFGYGGSTMQTGSWVPSELSEHYLDLEEADMNRIRMQALGAVLRPLLSSLSDDNEGKRFKEMAEKGALTPLDLNDLEAHFAKKAKENEDFAKKFSNDDFKHLTDKFKNRFEEVFREFKKDSQFLKDRMHKAKAHIHVSHHPVHSDLGYFDDEQRRTGRMTGGIMARQAIIESGNKNDKNYSGYTVGLYGHTHKSGVDVIQKDNGKMFYAISTKGMNYDERNSDEKAGIAKIRNNLKGEFAEVELNNDYELSKVIFHDVAGKDIYKSREMTKEEILDKKHRRNNDRVQAFNSFDYRDSDYYRNAA